MKELAQAAPTNVTSGGKTPVLGRRLSLRDLPGFGQKWLVVPEGQEGILIGGALRREVLPPGRHRVISWRDRLLGNLAGRTWSTCATF